MENTEIKKEQEFLALLQDTLKQARRKGGRITKEEIGEIFGEFSLEKSQTEQIEAYLRAHKIMVGTRGAEEEDLQDEERAFLISYRQMLEDVPSLPAPVLEAVRISAMAGEPSAQKELSEQMLGTVVDIARLYSGQGTGIEELVAAGNEALVTGVSLLGHLDSPDEVEGELARRIMEAMEDLVSLTLDQGAIDRQIEETANLVADKAKELAEALGRKVTVAELAGEGEVSREQIEDAIRLTGGRIEDLETGC